MLSAGMELGDMVAPPDGEMLASVIGDALASVILNEALPPSAVAVR